MGPGQGAGTWGTTWPLLATWLLLLAAWDARLLARLLARQLARVDARLAADGDLAKAAASSSLIFSVLMPVLSP